MSIMTKRWIYRLVVYDDKNGFQNNGLEPPFPAEANGLRDYLTEAGQKGWELCGVMPSTAQFGADTVATQVFIFKRDAAYNEA